MDNNEKLVKAETWWNCISDEEKIKIHKFIIEYGWQFIGEAKT